MNFYKIGVISNNNADNKNNKLYREALENLIDERDREFCNHTIEHFIDV